VKILIAEDEPLIQIINQKLMNDWGFQHDIVSH